LDPSSYAGNISHLADVFNEQKTFLRHHIKSYKLKTALMILFAKSMLPTDSVQLKQLHDKFKDLFSWKVISKADQLRDSKLSTSKATQSKTIN